MIVEDNKHMSEEEGAENIENTAVITHASIVQTLRKKGIFGEDSDESLWMVNNENFKQVVDTINSQIRDIDIRMSSYELLKQKQNREILCSELITYTLE